MIASKIISVQYSAVISVIYDSVSFNLVNTKIYSDNEIDYIISLFCPPHPI